MDTTRDLTEILLHDSAFKLYAKALGVYLCLWVGWKVRVSLLSRLLCFRCGAPVGINVTVRDALLFIVNRWAAMTPSDVDSR